MMISTLRCDEALRIGVVVCLSCLFAGCEEQSVQPIQWQLPLNAPEDPHASSSDEALPEWASLMDGDVHLRLLATGKDRQYNFVMALHGEVALQGMTIRLLGLSSGLRVRAGRAFNDLEVENPAAFLEVKRDDRVVFRGWLYRDFPELFAPDVPGWKFFLDAATVRRPSPIGDEEIQGSLSSAG
ncbi:MAG: DUF2155 domain-containing protein [Mariprofundales bacterium]